MNRYRQYNEECRRKCSHLKQCSGIISYLYFSLLTTVFLPLIAYICVFPFQSTSLIYGFVNLFSLAIFCLLFSVSFLSLFQKLNSTRQFQISHQLTLLSFWLRLIDSMLTLESVSSLTTLLLQILLFALYLTLSGIAFRISRRSVINIWEGLLSLDQSLVKLCLVIKSLQRERREEWICENWLFLGIGIGYVTTIIIGIARVSRKR